MTRVRAHVAVAVSLLCSAIWGSDVEAQDWFLDVAVDRAFSSSDLLRSPGGFSAGTGAIAVWGPLGFHVTYRDVSDGGDDFATDCSGTSLPCDPGTFAVSYEERAAGLGISYDFINPTDVMLTLAFTGTRNWRREKVTHLSTGRPYDHEVSSSFGFSAAAQLRLRPLMGGMRPELGLRYDHSGRGRCGVDIACWQGHDAFGLSFGFSWVLRERRSG